MLLFCCFTIKMSSILVSYVAKHRGSYYLNFSTYQKQNPHPFLAGSPSQIWIQGYWNQPLQHCSTTPASGANDSGAVTHCLEPKPVHGPVKVRQLFGGSHGQPKKRTFGIQSFITIARLWQPPQGVIPKRLVIAETKSPNPRVNGITSVGGMPCAW